MKRFLQFLMEDVGKPYGIGMLTRNGIVFRALTTKEFTLAVHDDFWDSRIFNGPDKAFRYDAQRKCVVFTELPTDKDIYIEIKNFLVKRGPRVKFGTDYFSNHITDD